jgi:hypothetical protein
VPGFRYRLLDEDGEDLSPFVAGVPNWKPGHTLHRRGGGTWEVVRVVDAEKDDPEGLRGYLVVRAIEDAQV